MNNGWPRWGSSWPPLGTVLLPLWSYLRKSKDYLRLRSYHPGMDWDGSTARRHRWPFLFSPVNIYTINLLFWFDSFARMPAMQWFCSHHFQNKLVFFPVVRALMHPAQKLACWNSHRSKLLLEMITFLPERLLLHRLIDACHFLHIDRYLYMSHWYNFSH